MSNPTVQDLLKKINFIEADVEIQKQILFSIPSDQQDEMEKVVKIIAERKKEIDALRQQIKGIDPDEYDRIILFEEAVSTFRKLAIEKEFQTIVGRNNEEDCVLELKNSPDVQCLIKASDKDGNWTIVTMEGKILEFSGDEVAEKPPEVSKPLDFGNA